MIGDFEKQQFMIMRLNAGGGNTLKPAAIAADLIKERVYIAQNGACCLDSRDLLTVNSQTVGSYAGSDGFLAVLSYNLTQRYYWTPFVSGSYKSSSIDVKFYFRLSNFVVCAIFYCISLRFLSFFLNCAAVPRNCSQFRKKTLLFINPNNF